MTDMYCVQQSPMIWVPPMNLVVLMRYLDYPTVTLGHPCPVCWWEVTGTFTTSVGETAWWGTWLTLTNGSGLVHSSHLTGGKSSPHINMSMKNILLQSLLVWFLLTLCEEWIFSVWDIFSVYWWLACLGRNVRIIQRSEKERIAREQKRKRSDETSCSWAFHSFLNCPKLFCGVSNHGQKEENIPHPGIHRRWETQNSLLLGGTDNIGKAIV